MDFSKLRTYAFITLLIGATLLFLFLLKPFAYPIFWAAVIAALIHPVHTRIRKYIRRPNLSAGLTLLIVTFIIVIPIALLGFLLFNEAVSIYTKIQHNQSYIVQTFQETFSAIQKNPAIARLNIDQQSIVDKISVWSNGIPGYLAQFITNFTQNSLVFVAMFLIMMYTLFYFLRDGEKLLHKLMYLMPFGDRFENTLYQKFTSTASATIKGTVIVGLIQGSLGGIMFAIAGIDGAIIWAIIMAFFSIIPGIGSAVIWFPAAILLILTGRIWQGIMIILVGALVIGTVDNLLRPILVGKNIEMHELLIFFSTLGGIALFGLSGFMIGPIIAALLLSFWRIYERFFSSELAHDDG